MYFQDLFWTLHKLVLLLFLWGSASETSGLVLGVLTIVFFGVVTNIFVLSVLRGSLFPKTFVCFASEFVFLCLYLKYLSVFPWSSHYHLLWCCHQRFCLVCFKRFFIPQIVCLFCFRIYVSLSVFELSFSFPLKFSLSS